MDLTEVEKKMILKALCFFEANGDMYTEAGAKYSDEEFRAVYELIDRLERQL